MHPLTTDLGEQILSLVKIQAYSLLGAIQDNKVVLGGSAGSGGGTGEPPAGFVGQLAQSNVTYDTAGSSRACDAGTSGSLSLVDNLDAIRLGTEICNDAIGDRHIDWGYGAGQVNSADIPFRTVTFDGASGANVITVPDNLAEALSLVDDDGLEYMRIVSTDAQPAVVFNEGGADIDFRVEGVGAPNAFRIAGDTGYVGVGLPNPSTPLHVYHATENILALFESGDANAYFNFIDSGTTGIGWVGLGAINDDMIIIAGGDERVRIDSAGNTYPGGSKTQDLGITGHEWDDLWYQTAHVNADFFYLDERMTDGGTLVPIDDLAVIQSIRPSGRFDERSGLPIIDDSSLPEWMLSRVKDTGEIARCKAGKPSVSNKVMHGLAFGAIRQLAERLERLEAS